MYYYFSYFLKKKGCWLFKIWLHKIKGTKNQAYGNKSKSHKNIWTETPSEDIRGHCWKEYKVGKMSQRGWAFDCVFGYQTTLYKYTNHQCPTNKGCAFFVCIYPVWTCLRSNYLVPILKRGTSKTKSRWAIFC